MKLYFHVSFSPALLSSLLEFPVTTNYTGHVYRAVVGSNFACTLILLYYVLCLVGKVRAIFSTNGNPNQNQSYLARTRFPALGAGGRYFL